MGLVDAVMGTAVSGYAVFRLTNMMLERVFFKVGKEATVASMPCGRLKD